MQISTKYVDKCLAIFLFKDHATPSQLAGFKLIAKVMVSTILSLLFLTSCSDPRSDGLALGEERSTSNEAKITQEIISLITDISIDRYPQQKIKRFNQSKTLGCFDANFVIDDNLSSELRHGIFSEKASFPAVVRFANATKDDDREKDFRGMSIRVLNITGDRLWGESGRQDFLLNSHPVLFAKDGSDFLEFIEATSVGKLWQYFIRPSHFYSLKIALLGREKHTNPMAIQYWSTTPFRHGPDETKAVKYSVKPCDSASSVDASLKSPDSFSEVMNQQLNKAPACFDFMVQFQTDPQKMPIENASKIWDEKDSPFQTVAKITIEQQDFGSAKNMAACEEMTFNPWQGITDHQPLGDINRLRKTIYSEVGTFRINQNSRRE